MKADRPPKPMTIRNLDALFKPDTIALICGGGDSEEIIARNLMSGGFKGPIMPVDPKREALAGAFTYHDIASLPLAPTLAIITRPLREAPALIRQLGERGARAALLISEARGLPSAERAALAQAILDAAQPYLLRVLGTRFPGLQRPPLQPQRLPEPPTAPARRYRLHHRIRHDRANRPRPRHPSRLRVQPI